VTRRILAPAHDGETVPVSVLYRKGTKLDGTAPLLLYGYGAYGHAIPASFSTNRLSLVDRGMVYAIAHIRGGTDKGWRWYREGKLAHKENTFRDFIAAAEHLIAERYTAKGRIVAHGGSAGGMLMGAVANMRPELFGGILAEVPFVDVLNTMLDDTLPLTPPEWPNGAIRSPTPSVPAHCRLFALRPGEGAGLSGDAGARGPDRSARDLLGAGQMGGAAARHEDRRQSAVAQDQHGCRPRRRGRPLRPAGGSGAGLCVCPAQCRARLSQ
jgi:hypothetical protein